MLFRCRHIWRWWRWGLRTEDCLLEWRCFDSDWRRYRYLSWQLSWRTWVISTEEPLLLTGPEPVDQWHRERQYHRRWNVMMSICTLLSKVKLRILIAHHGQGFLETARLKILTAHDAPCSVHPLIWIMSSITYSEFIPVTDRYLVNSSSWGWARIHTSVQMYIMQKEIQLRSRLPNQLLHTSIPFRCLTCSLLQFVVANEGIYGIIGPMWLYNGAVNTWTTIHRV